MLDDWAQQTPPPPRPFRAGKASLTWDATKAEVPAELLQSGFQLAYFIFPDRLGAIEILVHALEKLHVRSRREMKKLYWRDKHSERPVRRIARNDIDILQWLIMSESEQYERTQERMGTPSPANMMIRYVKHLVQITTALSSFYVNVGVTRLLHNYSTSEAQRVYELLTSRYLGPDEYRRSKSVLMDRIGQRFTNFLNVTRTEHGELRFVTVEDVTRWAGLIDDCLRAFTPWSTQSNCIQFVNAAGIESANSGSSANQNENEIRACHMLIEPDCYSRLIRELAFNLPHTKLAVPRFVMPEKQNKNDDDSLHPRHPVELAQQDVEDIQRRLAATDERRRNIKPSAVTVVIDGVEHARLSLEQRTEFQLGLEAGTSLIEIRAEDKSGGLLLATHVISYMENEFEHSKATKSFNSGKLTLEVTPTTVPKHRVARAILSLNYEPRFMFTRTWVAWRARRILRRAVRWYAMAAVVAALIGWGSARFFYLHQIRSLEEELQKTQHDHTLSPSAARAIVSYVLTRDDLRVRAMEGDGVPEISLRLHSPAISLELPLQAIPAAQSYTADLKTFAGDRTLMTQNFLQPVRTENGEAIEIVVPSDFLRAGDYYTVHLRSSDRTDLFSFKVTLGK